MAATQTADGTVSVLEAGASTAPDDHSLMAAVKDGDEDAFEAFYARHQPGVMSFCRHILGNREDAEDAVQHTFVAAYKRAQAEGPPDHPSAWLYKVARNRSLTMISARRESPREGVEPATAGLAEEVERRFELRALLRDLSRLPEEQRASLVLFELGGLNQTEIGEVLESPPDKVKAFVYQARHSLMDRAVARDTECREIRRRLSTIRGGRLNDRTLKHHLEACAGCRAFRDEVTVQRRSLAILLPVMPLVDFHQRVFALLGIGGGTAGTAGGGGSASAASLRPRGRLSSHSTVAKVVAGGAVAATAAVALTLGGDEVKPVASPAQAAPVAPRISPQPVPRSAPQRRVKAARRTGRRESPPPVPTVIAETPVDPVSPTPPAAAPPKVADPVTPRRQRPRRPLVPAPDPPPPPIRPAPAPAPAPEPTATPEVTPAPVVPAPTCRPAPPGHACAGHPNGAPGPAGNPQPHGPPPGWDPANAPAPKRGKSSRG